MSKRFPFGMSLSKTPTHGTVLSISTEIEPIDVLGRFEPVENPLTRRVFINGQRMPEMIERMILMGLDQMTAEHLKKVREEMDAIGWRFT